MTDEKSGKKKKDQRDDIDPIRLMREWFVQSEQMWSDAMSDLLVDERVAKNTGRFMQEALHTQRLFSESMGQYLSGMNMPTRTDILDLRDRVSQMEDSLNSVLVELRAMRAERSAAASSGPSPAPAKKPARTRKAAKHSESAGKTKQ